MVMTSYARDEIADLTMGSRRGSATLHFSDGSEIGLKSVSGVAKHTQLFLELFERYIAGEHVSAF